MTSTQRVELTVRSARETDLNDLEDMIDDFVQGHPAECLWYSSDRSI